MDKGDNSSYSLVENYWHLTAAVRQLFFYIDVASCRLPKFQLMAPYQGMYGSVICYCIKKLTLLKERKNIEKEEDALREGCGG